MLRMPRKHTARFLAPIACLLLATQVVRAQQPADNTQLLGKQAVHAVGQRVLLIANNPVPKTGKQLPTDGHWSIGTETPSACPAATPGNNRPCLRVIYTDPDAGVSCEWVVLLDQDGATGSILDENDDAAHYFMQKLTPETARPLVLKRGDPVYPPIAIAAHVQGDVKMQVVVGPDGKPVVAVIVSGPPMLNGAAREAVGGWTFQPLQIGTRAVMFQTEITFRFTTSGPPFGKISSIP
jgi:TonB family protein